jgi:hypothetical protein
MRIPVRRRLLLETIDSSAGASFRCKLHRRDYFPFNWHYHPEIELTLIVKGRGQRFVGDSVHDYADGDLCLLGAGLPHTWHSRPARGLRVSAVVVQFLPDFLGTDFTALPEARRIRELFVRAQRGLAITGRTRSQIAAQMLSMEKEPPGLLPRVCMLLSILHALAESTECRPLAFSRAHSTLNAQASRTINTVCGMINADLQNIPSQAAAARPAAI